MLFNRTRRNAEEHHDTEVDRARLAALEAAQRLDPYAAGPGDRPPRRRRGLVPVRLRGRR
jgi:hypothetical protein